MNGAMNFENANPNHFEVQEAQHCAKHAINHVLQEAKITFKNPPFVTAEGEPASGKYIEKDTGYSAMDISDPLDETIQINLYKLCDEYDILLMKTSEIIPENVNIEPDVLNTYIDILKGEIEDESLRCDDTHDNLPFDAIENILRDELHYRVVRVAKDVRKFYCNTILLELDTRIRDPDLLGVIFNLGGGHYTALSKFVKGHTLWKLLQNHIILDKVAYIDSIPARSKKKVKEPQIVVKPVEEMIDYLDKLDKTFSAEEKETVTDSYGRTKTYKLSTGGILSAVFVYVKQRGNGQPSYESVTVKRLLELQTLHKPIQGGGKKKQTRRAKRSAKKTRRLTKSI